MDYDTFVYKLGSLHSMLSELAEQDLYQGEHTIHYTGKHGIQRTLHVYVDGTEIQLSDTPPSTYFNLSISAD
jgi:hypothetical protein